MLLIIIMILYDSIKIKLMLACIYYMHESKATFIYIIIFIFKISHFRQPAKRTRRGRDSGDTERRSYEVVWPECFFDSTGNSETYAYYIKYVDLNCTHHACTQQMCITI